MTTAIKTENLGINSLENFDFYVDEPEFGHVIANFSVQNKTYRAFLQLPDSPDSEHELQFDYNLNRDLVNDNDEVLRTKLLQSVIQKIKQNFNCDDDYLSYIATGVDIKRNKEIVCDLTWKSEEFWLMQGVNNRYYLVKQYEIGGYNMFTSELIKEIKAGNFAQACDIAKKYLDNEYKNDEE